LEINFSAQVALSKVVRSFYHLGLGDSKNTSGIGCIGNLATGSQAENLIEKMAQWLGDCECGSKTHVLQGFNNNLAWLFLIIYEFRYR